MHTCHRYLLPRTRILHLSQNTGAAITWDTWDTCEKLGELYIQTSTRRQRLKRKTSTKRHPSQSNTQKLGSTSSHPPDELHHTRVHLPCMLRNQLFSRATQGILLRQRRWLDSVPGWSGFDLTSSAITSQRRFDTLCFGLLNLLWVI